MKNWGQRDERIMATLAATFETTGEQTVISGANALELYRRMLTVSAVEERIQTFAKQGKITFQASTRGHELFQLAAAMLLEPGKDWFFTYYRSKAVAIGLGMPLKDIFLAMLSREGDPNSNGRNMPEHWSSKELHLVARSAVTGTQYLNAIGAARAVRLQGSDALAWVASGEGATSEGEFFEALNWAGLEKLPILFGIQNNGYAISVPQQSQTGSAVHRIAEGFGVRSYTVDGTSVEDVFSTLPGVIESIRQGSGPALIEASVVRLDPHSSSDDHRKYRSASELQVIPRRDPMLRLEQYVMNRGLIDEAAAARLRAEIRDEVEEAAREADSRPQPSGHDLMAHIYASEPAPPETKPHYMSGESVTLIDAVNHGLREEMERNPNIVMWGEDIADPKGGVFGVTRGLSTSFPGRVFNSPLAEASIAGVAAGMAVAGYKPIVEMQFGDYLWPAALQLRNEIPTMRWRSQGAWECPVVVRVAVGGYIKGGPWHSACVESFFAHIPGWRVAFPSNAEDAKGLIKAAARSKDPVVFLEHKGLYRKPQARSLEPDDEYVLPFGRGAVRREGSDVTIVTWGSTVYLALELARQMEQQNRSLEVLDLRTLAPLDEELIYRSVRKTNRVIVAHEDTLTGGFGAEIVARIAENCIGSLDAPVLRVAAKDTFVPAASNLELMALPSVADLRAAVEKLIAF